MIDFNTIKSTFSHFYGEENVDFQFEEGKDLNDPELMFLDIIVRIEDYELQHGTQSNKSVPMTNVYLKFTFNRKVGKKDIGKFHDHLNLALTRTRIDGHESAWGGYHSHSSGGSTEPQWASLCEGSLLQSTRVTFNEDMSELNLIVYLETVDDFLKTENSSGHPYRYLDTLIERRDNDADLLDIEKRSGFTKLGDQVNHSVVSDLYDTLYFKYRNGFQDTYKEWLHSLFPKDEELLIGIDYIVQRFKFLLEFNKPEVADTLTKDEVIDLINTIEFNQCLEIQIDFDTNVPYLNITSERKLAVILLLIFIKEEMTALLSGNYINFIHTYVKVESSYRFSLTKKLYHLLRNLENPYLEGFSLKRAEGNGSGYSQNNTTKVPHIFSFKGEQMMFEIYKFIHPKLLEIQNKENVESEKDTLPESERYRLLPKVSNDFIEELKLCFQRKLETEGSFGEANYFYRKN